MDGYRYMLKMRKGKRFNNKKHKRRIENTLRRLGIKVLLEVPNDKNYIRFVIEYDSLLDDKARLLDFIIRTTVDVDEVLLVPVVDRKPYLRQDLDRNDIVGA